jgi:WD40 repeat protein
MGQLEDRTAVVIGSGDDGTVRMWDLARGEPIGEPLPGHNRRVSAVAVAQLEGRTVAVIGGPDATVRLSHLVPRK